MANTKFNHVWVIDTPAAIVDDEPVCIRTIRWVGTIAGAETVEITDLDPKLSAPVVWESAASVAGAIAEESNPWDLTLMFGFGVPTLGAGKLYVYLAHVGMR